MRVVDLTLSGVDGPRCVKLDLMESSNAGHQNIIHENSDCVAKS